MNGPLLSSPHARTTADDLLFAEASAQRVWRHEDGTGRRAAGVEDVPRSPSSKGVATAEAAALVLCGDQNAVTVADDGTRETLWAAAATEMLAGATPRHCETERHVRQFSSTATGRPSRRWRRYPWLLPSRPDAATTLRP